MNSHQYSFSPEALEQFFSELPSIGWRIGATAEQMGNIRWESSKQDKYRSASTRSVQFFVRELDKICTENGKPFSSDARCRIRRIVMQQLFSDPALHSEWAIYSLTGKLLFTVTDGDSGREICKLLYQKKGILLQCLPCEYEEWRRYSPKTMADVKQKDRLVLPLKPAAKLAFYAMLCVFQPRLKRRAFQSE